MSFEKSFDLLMSLEHGGNGGGGDGGTTAHLSSICQLIHRCRS